MSIQCHHLIRFNKKKNIHCEYRLCPRLTPICLIAYRIFSTRFMFAGLSVGELVTASIRPTIMYGEEDHLFFPTLAKVTKKFGGLIPKVLGAGGKHQQTYVGMCARNSSNFIVIIFFFRRSSTHRLLSVVFFCSLLRLQEMWPGLTFVSRNR